MSEIIASIFAACLIYFGVIYYFKSSTKKILGEMREDIEEEKRLSRWGVGEADRKLLSAIDASPHKEFFREKEINLSEWNIRRDGKILEIGFLRRLEGVYNGSFKRLDIIKLGPGIEFHDSRGEDQVLFYNPTEKTFSVLNTILKDFDCGKTNGGLCPSHKIGLKITDPEKLATFIIRHIERADKEREENMKAQSLEKIILGNKNNNYDNV